MIFNFSFLLSFENDIEKFKANASHCVNESNRKVFDNPPINADDPYSIK